MNKKLDFRAVCFVRAGRGVCVCLCLSEFGPACSGLGAFHVVLIAEPLVVWGGGCIHHGLEFLAVLDTGLGCFIGEGAVCGRLCLGLEESYGLWF